MKHIRTLANSTLMGMTKKELIEYVRICEFNVENAYAQIDQQAKNIGKLLKEQPPREKGQWELVEDDWNVYNCTVCNEWWHLEDGTPQENNMNFCPRCGADMSRNCPV